MTTFLGLRARFGHALDHGPSQRMSARTHFQQFLPSPAIEPPRAHRIAPRARAPAGSSELTPMELPPMPSHAALRAASRASSPRPNAPPSELREQAESRARERIAEADRAAEHRVQAAEEEAGEILQAARSQAEARAKRGAGLGRGDPRRGRRAPARGSARLEQAPRRLSRSRRRARRGRADARRRGRAQAEQVLAQSQEQANRRSPPPGSRPAQLLAEAQARVRANARRGTRRERPSILEQRAHGGAASSARAPARS